MKDVFWSQGAEQRAHLNRQWRTPFFKEKAATDAWLSGVIERVSRRPHAIASQSHAVERLHFSTFWNVWVFHEHENPFVFDLGVLHEVLHTLAFQKKRTWATTDAEWAKAPLSVMEKAVSLRTEVGVYARWPELRPCTFPFPIWSDRMVKNSWLEIKEERQHLLDMGKRGEVLEDPEENRIAKYARMNARWNGAWSAQGPKIESAWARAYTASSKDEQGLFERLWETDRKDGVPYAQLAERFGNSKKQL